MTTSKAMALAGQTCYDVVTRHLASLSFTGLMRTAILAACKSDQATQQRHPQQPIIWRTVIPRLILHEFHAGPLTPTQLKDVLELGGLCIEVTLTIEAESVFESLSSKDLKKPTE
eukprot:3988063-Pyramimonas_sp.AAC.1